MSTIHFFHYDACRTLTFTSYMSADSGYSLADQGFWYSGNGEKVICCGCGWEFLPRKSVSARSDHLYENPNCHLFRFSIVHGGELQHVTMGLTDGLEEKVARMLGTDVMKRSYKARLSTFDTQSSVSETLRAELADNGFYMGSHAKPICSYCQVLYDLSNRKEGEVFNNHKAMAPHCIFSRGIDVTDFSDFLTIN